MLVHRLFFPKTLRQGSVAQCLKGEKLVTGEISYEGNYKKGDWDNGKFGNAKLLLWDRHGAAWQRSCQK